MSEFIGALRDRLAERPALDVRADLAVEVDGHELSVESFTDHLVVTVPSVGTALSLLRRGGGRERFRSVATLLAAADLSADLRLGTRRVATAGAGIRPGPLARAAGLGPVRLHPLGAVLALLD